MPCSRYSFDRFTLDVGNRTLRRDGAAVEVSARYLDALALLVSEAGNLVTKDRFLQQVWNGVPVTEEALTQCIKTLRRHLGDDASEPRFIATVPKHGYRFIGVIEQAAPPGSDVVAVAAQSSGATRSSVRDVLVLGGAGTVGAGAAGIAGGLCYGSILASQQSGASAGGASVLLVILWLTIMVAMVGGAGVSLGIAAAGLMRAPILRLAGGALGGFVVGGLVKLLGLDAFNLLLGRSPDHIAGAAEGLLLGGAVGAGAWLTIGRTPSIARVIAISALTGCVGGILIQSLGGRMMGGSLESLAHTFPESRLRIDQIGSLFGESGFGLVAQLATSALEGALFSGCIVAAMHLHASVRAIGSEANVRS